MSTTVAASPIASASRVFGRFSLQSAFYSGVGLLFLFVAATARPQYLESAIGAAAIMLAAVLPSALWVYRGAQGLPIFSLFALTHIWSYALPLLHEHPIVAQFPAGSQLTGALTIASYLCLSTFFWNLANRTSRQVKANGLLLKEQSVDFLFLAALGSDVVFEAALLGGWFELPAGIYSILRALIIAVNALSCFILSFRLGARTLAPEATLAFKIVMVALVVVYLPALLMINAMSLIGISLFGYTLGSRRIPWKIAIGATAIFAFLHPGKADMRALYWSEANEEPYIQPVSYPGFMVEWVKVSFNAIFAAEESEDLQSISLLERAGLIHVFLYVQNMTPEAVPYLYGDTYTIIPRLLVPRIFSPDKGASHEGTYLLNIHYGFQTREDTARTTLAFGMPAEAYANFGLLGLAGLGIFLGAFYGLVERGARGMPVLSFRFLFAIIVVSYAIQSEYTAGVYAAGLFQSTVVLGLLALLLMRQTTLIAEKSVTRRKALQK